MLQNIIPFLPLATLIVLTITTKKMAESMIASLVLAVALLYRGSFLSGLTELMYEVLSDSSFQFVVIIITGFGGMITLFQESGALMGFRGLIEKWASGPKKSLLFAWLLAIVLCIDEYLEILTLTFSMRDVTDGARVPREHLAFQTSGMTCCLCLVIPFTSWTGFTVGLITEYGLGFYDYVKAIPFLFYPVIFPIVLLLLIFSVIPKVGGLKKAYERVESGGSVLPENDANSGIFDISGPSTEKSSSAWNVLIPLIVLIAGVVLNGNNLIAGLILALAAQFIIYISTRVMTVSEFFGHFFAGGKSMSSVVILVSFGFMLSKANRALGMFDILSDGFVEAVPAFLLPLIAFLTVAFVIFSVGTCWVVMTIVFPIFMPLALSCGVPAALMLGALLSGVSLGYTICFYADAAFMTAAGTGVSNVTVVRTALPYALATALVAAAGYLAMGLAFV